MTVQLVLRDVSVEDVGRVDVAIDHGHVAAIGPRLALRGDVEADGGGGAVIPGLWDHHVHLFATAARIESLSVAPANTPDASAFAAALRKRAREIAPDTWVRAVDYDDGVAGPLSAATLDRMVRDRPIRVQHRTGSLWVLNGAALATLASRDLPPGAERDGAGRPTGRFFREDGWLRTHLPHGAPDLAPVARALDGYGVIGVTDATVTTDTPGARALADAATRAGMRQRLVLMSGGADLEADPRYTIGPVKIVLDDAHLPSPDAVAAQIARAHAVGRVAATHCVTAGELAVALAGFAEAGTRNGDRIEHGGVIDPAGAEVIAALGLRVVTQPGFIAARGDRYLDTIDPAEHDLLYPCAGLIARGVCVAGSSDAPYGPLDPWAGMRAAVTRRTTRGRVLGQAERVAARQALGLWLSDPADPGGVERRVAIGSRADLCVLAAPLDMAIDALSADLVRHTIIGGEVLR